MLPSEMMSWQPEFTDKILSRKPGAVHTQSPIYRCDKTQANRGCL
ncbi:PapI protein [Escherichia coli]|nr:PapI protein [Escherichia coli]